MSRLTFVLVAATLSLAACKKKESGGTGAASGSAAASGSGSAAGPADPSMTNRAGNCPSTVAGAATSLVDDPDQAGKVVLTITAGTAAATDTIRKRVAHLVEIQGAPDADVKHTGKGTGGADMGMCPVVTSRDVKVSASDVEGGSKVVLESGGGVTADALRKDVAGRIERTQAWAAANIKSTDTSGGGGGTGGGKGDHGGNHSGKGDGTGKQEGGSGGGAGSSAAPPPAGAVKGATGQAGGNTM